MSLINFMPKLPFFPEPREILKKFIPFALSFANSRIARYGSITELDFPGHGSVRATIRLKGLEESITVTAQEVVFADDCSSVTLNGLSADVEFLNCLLQDFVEGKPIPLDGLPGPAKLMLPAVAKFILE